MRFAITASDRYLGVFESLVNAGWQPVKLFTTVIDNKIHHSKAVIEYAQRLAIDVQFSRLRESDLRELSQRGCDMLVIASYDWRIDDWHPYLKYAINFHPSPLPEGRGPYPVVQALLENRKYWGVTCHKVSREFDAGEILDKEEFPISDDECHESLDLKTQMTAKRLAERVAVNFTSLWDNAKPQGIGSYSRHWTNEDRTIDFSDGVNDILRRVRAFGLIEFMAKVNEVAIFIRRAVGWVEHHAHRPGALVHVNDHTMVVAARDGYIGIIEWSLHDPRATVGKIGR
ncbi:MAG TPA: formyltransferase family protein [Sulfuricella sp.]|nr:formyltransferase family protein [Sulfuricella sp.]